VRCARFGVVVSRLELGDGGGEGGGWAVGDLGPVGEHVLDAGLVGGVGIG